MRYLVVVIFSIFTLSSCSISPDDVTFNSLSKVDLQGMTNSQLRIVLAIDVENTSRRNVTIKTGELKLSDASGDIVEIVIREKILIPKRSKGDIVVPIDIKATNSLGMLGVALRLKGRNPVVSGSMLVSSGVITKDIKMDNIPLPVFLKKLGIDDLKSLNLPL